MQYWWIGDYHFGHKGKDAEHGILAYTDRSKVFDNIEQHDEGLIEYTNAVVHPGDLLIIAGDVSFSHNKELVYKKYINRLNGTKIIVKGNHDYWMGKGKGRYIYHKKIGDTFTVTCHYAGRVWNRSHRGAIQLHGHSHGTLDPWRNQLDVGVDNAIQLLGEYRPFNIDEIKSIVKQNSNMKLWSRMVQKSAQKDCHRIREEEYDM
jgi:calcineurin-like phosphoesterase family protein